MHTRTQYAFGCAALEWLEEEDSVGEGEDEVGSAAARFEEELGMSVAIGIPNDLAKAADVAVAADPPALLNLYIQI